MSDQAGPDHGATDPTRPRVDHAPGCQRRHVPILVHDLIGAPVFVCVDCCATTPADQEHPPAAQNQPQGRP